MDQSEVNVLLAECSRTGEFIKQKHSAGRAFTSDWSVYSFIIVINRGQSILQVLYENLHVNMFPSSKNSAALYSTVSLIRH